MAGILKAALAAALLIATPAAFATAIAAPAKKEEAKTPAKKELTPQQRKMKDCAAKWGQEKKAKKVSGQKAYRAFMSKCLQD